MLPTCNGLDYPIGRYADELSREERQAIEFAVDEAFVRAALRRAGFDADDARTLAETYTADRVAFRAADDAETDEALDAPVAAGDDPEHRLVRQAARLPRDPGAPALQEPEDCGWDFPVAGVLGGIAIGALLGGPSYDRPRGFRFVTEPADASVFVIPRFSFRVCEKRFANPYSRSDCTGWRKVLAGTTARLDGTYEYSVEWPDGAQERERANFEPQAGVQDVRIVKPAR